MFNKLIPKTKILEENTKKDFKKLAHYVIHAKGHRTINGFSADMRINPNDLADIINARINSYPAITLLKLIADHSEGRVTLKELTLACGYSNCPNNNSAQIKNIHVRRGWFCWVDMGDNCLDSEYGLKRLCLIIQNDKGNMFSGTTICVPITSRRSKPLMPTHVFAEKEKYGLREDSIISCEQVRCISKRRLIFNGAVQKVSEAPLELMSKVEVALARAQGIIGLHVSEQEAIEALMNLNNGKQKTYQYENNYSRNTNRQVACAY